MSQPLAFNPQKPQNRRQHHQERASPSSKSSTMSFHFTKSTPLRRGLKRAKLILAACILFLIPQPDSSIAHAQTYPSVTPATVGEAWGQTLGLTMFRGNPTRTFYGTGPLPRQTPRQLWRYPDRPMCSESCVGKQCSTWCGSGWTGQPVVWERPDGITEVIFGAYDRQVHFVDAQTGRPTRAPYPTGDIIKGSVTLDPDGFPLLYFGSRDNKYRVLALDQEPVREVYSLNAHNVARRLWNDDWDGNASIVEDRLFIGGENSWFYVVKLNRSRDSQGRVRVQPEIEVQMPGWTPEMQRQLGNHMLSIESSVVVFGTRAYWTNSGGMVVGVDWTRVKNKQAEVVFTYWVGDDVDATPVIDERGHLYIAVEYELEQGRAQRASRQRIEEVGQLIKLDPHNTRDPKIWSIAIPPRGGDGKGGIWSTPALDLKRNQIIVTTHPGDLIILDRDTGREKHRQRLGFHEWSSPIVIGDDLLLGRCQKTGLEMWDLASSSLTSLWSTRSPTGCVESTPAVWRGRIYVGSRDGYFYAFGP
ncbi:MAG TPA: PQQ-binding-like beta-propeller repeat protein [Pseudobdellovibrionaceae bacterium]|nr:PQQ-binding-like beta-propeller repeat protein [Pseudobdellovibrionaceae bacterium]